MSDKGLKRGSDVLFVLALVVLVAAIAGGPPALYEVAGALALFAVQLTLVLRGRRRGRRAGG